MDNVIPFDKYKQEMNEEEDGKRREIADEVLDTINLLRGWYTDES